MASMICPPQEAATSVDPEEMLVDGELVNADEINADRVNVNTVSGFRTDHMPYSGFKDSGKNKEGLKYVVKHFTREKPVDFHAGKNA